MTKGMNVGALAVLAFVGMAASAQAVDKPRIAVKDFEYGTINNWWGREDIGKGMADQVMNELQEDGTFQVVERKNLDTVLAEQDFARSDRADPSAAKVSKTGHVKGARYILVGSITKFGTEEKNFGGGGFVKGKLGGLGLKKAKTQVALTVRLIDSTTGDLVLTAKGEGVSTKGGGLSAGAGSWGGAGGFHMGSSEYKDSAIGEAQELATKAVVKEIASKKDKLEAQ